MPVLQDSICKITTINREMLIFTLQCVWKIIPHIDSPGQDVLSTLQRCVLGVGVLAGSHGINTEVLNVIFALWPKWGVQVWAPEDGMLENLGEILCLALQSEPYPNLLNAGKLVQGVVKFIFLQLKHEYLARLESIGVHNCFRRLLLHYEAFTWQQFQAVITGCGVMEDIMDRSNDYLQEGVLEMLLFAGTEFTNTNAREDNTEAEKQWDIWTLLSLLCRQNCNISSSLYISGTLDVVMSVLSSPAVEKAPIYQFVASLMSGNPDIKTNILEDTTIIADVNSTLLEGSNSSSIDSSAIKAGEVFTSLTENMTHQVSVYIIQQQLLGPLLLGAQRHPQFLAECALLCVQKLVILGSIRQDSSTKCQPGSELDLDKVESELFQITIPDTIYSATYKDGYHTFLQNLLESKALSDPKLVSLLYQTIKSFWYYCPSKVSHVLLTKDFLFSMVQASKQHLSLFRDISVTLPLANAVSSITYSCVDYPVFAQRLQAAGMHELVVCALDSSPNELTLVQWLMALVNLIDCYRHHLKDVKCMFECGIHKELFSTALQYGMWAEVGAKLGQCLVNWTRDKDSLDRFSEENFAVELVPLLEHQYTESLRRAVIHVVANIASGNWKTKEALLEREIHVKLLKHIRNRCTQCESTTYLSACCRVLYIISSSHSGKMMLLEHNCIKIMMELAQSSSDKIEVEWRSVSVISNVCFLPVSCRHHIYNHELLQFLSLLLKTSNRPKLLGYAVRVLLALVEDDEGLALVAGLHIEEKLRSLINNPKHVAAFGDLKYWGNVVLEKLQLHAIIFPQVLFNSLDIPPLPNLRSECTNSLRYCRGRATLRGERYECFVPEAPRLSNADCDKLAALGRNPYEIFRVGRLFGCTNGLCSNCSKNGSSLEFVLRAHSLSSAHYQELITMGWYRRGGVKMFRSYSVHGIECCDWETRIVVKDFSAKSHKSFAKTLRRMPKDLEVVRKPSYFNPEAFELYQTYHVNRFNEKPKSEHGYVDHVVNSPIHLSDGRQITLGTFHDEYRFNGKLVAVSVLDLVPKGMVGIYTWYDTNKEISKYSFGVYSILKEIQEVQERQKTDPCVEYHYLEGWNEHNRRLKYKGDYEPLEYYAPCVTDCWISSKEGVKEEKRMAVEQRERQQQPPDNRVLGNLPISAPLNPTNSNSGQRPKEKDPFLSLDNDRVAYQRESSVPRVDDLIICLNHQMFMTFGELKHKFPLFEAQKELLEKRFEELMLAVGANLSLKMVVDLLVVPV